MSDTIGTRDHLLLLCDMCGRVHLGDDASDAESCECGRLKQRLDFLTLADVQRMALEAARWRFAEQRLSRAVGDSLAWGIYTVVGETFAEAVDAAMEGK